jgi:hypothetical protein
MGGDRSDTHAVEVGDRPSSKELEQIRVFGFELNNGAPLKSVEVSVDGGPWQAAALDKSNTRFSWKLFTFDWKDATPGEHTLVSRATDADGIVQPTRADLSRKKTA